MESACLEFWNELPTTTTANRHTHTQTRTHRYAPHALAQLLDYGANLAEPRGAVQVCHGEALSRLRNAPRRGVVLASPADHLRALFAYAAGGGEWPCAL